MNFHFYLVATFLFCDCNTALCFMSAFHSFQTKLNIVLDIPMYYCTLEGGYDMSNMDEIPTI